MAKKRKFKKSKPKSAHSVAPSHSAPPPADSPPQAPAATYLRSALPSHWRSFLSTLLIVLAAAPAVVAPYGHYAGYTPDLHIAAFAQVLAALILLLFSLALIKRSSFQLPRSPVTPPLLLLLLWAALSIFWSIGLFNALFASLNWLGGVLAFVAVLLILRDWDKQRQLLTGIAFSGLLLGLLGISQFLFGIDWVIQVAAPAATLGNKNMFGQFILMTMPPMFFLFLTTGDRDLAKIWAYAIATALMLGALAYVRSKAAWLALAVEATLAAVILIYLRLCHGYKPLASWHKKAALTLIVLIPLGMAQTADTIPNERAAASEAAADADSAGKQALSKYGDLDSEAPVSEAMWESFIDEARQQQTTADQLRQSRHATTDSLLVRVSTLIFGDSDSGSIRLTIWLNSYFMWRDHWLRGVGIGNWTNLYPTYQSAYKQETQARGSIFHPHVHNDYLEILCELGIIGFALFAWLLFGAGRLALRAITSFDVAKPERATLAFGPIIALAGIAIGAVFSFPFQQPMTVLLICVYLGVLSLHYANARGGLARTFSIPHRPIKIAVALVATTATVALTTLHYGWYMAEKHYRLGAYHFQSDELEKAEREAYNSLSFNSIYPLPKWMLSTILVSLGRHSEAIKLSDEILKESPYLSNIVRAKIYAYKRLRRPSDAARVIGELSKVDSRLILLLRRAALLDEAGLFDEAAEAYSALRKRTLVALALCGERGRPRCETIAKKIRRIDRWISRAQERAAKDAAKAPSAPTE